jgi:hypothetical protein
MSVWFKNETHAQKDLLKPIVTAQVRSASATKVVRKSKQLIMAKLCRSTQTIAMESKIKLLVFMGQHRFGPDSSLKPTEP